MKKFFPKFVKYDDQQGIALLITVMLVSAIAIITITVAFFVVQEIRESRSSTLTGPAIGAAETAGEQGIFTIKRGATLAGCATASPTQLDGVTTGGTQDVRIKKCLRGQAITLQVTAASPFTFFLYDRNNVNGNLCMEDGTCNATGGGTGNQIYTYVKVTYLTGSYSLGVNIETLDGVTVANGTILSGITGRYLIPRDILNSTDERLKVTLTPSNGTATVEVTTEDAFTADKGLPDYNTIDAEGCKAVNSIVNCDSPTETYKRRINITLPN